MLALNLKAVFLRNSTQKMRLMVCRKSCEICNVFFRNCRFAAFSAHWHVCDYWCERIAQWRHWRRLRRWWRQRWRFRVAATASGWASSTCDATAARNTWDCHVYRVSLPMPTPTPPPGVTLFRSAWFSRLSLLKKDMFLFLLTKLLPNLRFSWKCDIFSSLSLSVVTWHDMNSWHLNTYSLLKFMQHF